MNLHEDLLILHSAQSTTRSTTLFFKAHIGRRSTCRLRKRKARWSARDWAKALVAYRQPSAARGIFELIVTFPPFVAVWTAMLLASSHGLFLLVFRSRAARRRPAYSPVPDPARLRARIVLSEQARQRLGGPSARRLDGHALRSLAAHPRDPSRVIGQPRPARHRRHQDADGARIFCPRLAWPALYRLYRHPLVMFGLGPAYTFLIESRLALRLHAKGPMPWVSTMTTNAGIALAAGVLILCMGFTTFVIVHVPIVVLAATMGVWLFYVQHQFEATTWDEATDWSQPKRRCMAARITTCRCRCVGSAPILVCITCITCRAACPFIASRDFARLSRAPPRRPTDTVAKPRLRPSGRCGTRKRGASCRFARRGRRTPLLGG